MANALFSKQNESTIDRPNSSRVLDNQVRVSTPENIAFQYEITGPFRRLMAYLTDVIITIAAFLILAFVIWVAFMLVGSFLATGGGALFLVLADMAVGILSALAFLSLWFYGAYMETYFDGRTFGKMLANIRTISVDGSAIDGSQATLRNFFRGLDVAPFISLGMIFGPEAGYAPFIPIFAFGLICMTVSPKFQRIGDLVAGTIVVTEEKKWTQGLASFQDSRVAQLADLIPESFVVTPGLAKALAEYVDRRRVLPQQRVAEVASHLGNPLVDTFRMPKNTDHDLLLCSLYYKTFIEFKNKDDNPFSATGLEPAAESLATFERGER